MILEVDEECFDWRKEFFFFDAARNSLFVVMGIIEVCEKSDHWQLEEFLEHAWIS